MKKTGVLNSHISRIIAAMGHTDKLVICDSGLPIPRNSDMVDLALTKNIPRFFETLKVVLEELCIEGVIVADEMVNSGNGLYTDVAALLKGVKVQKVSHEKFKEIIFTEKNISFIRTGEATPYANIILISGVTFP